MIKKLDNKLISKKRGLKIKNATCEFTLQDSYLEVKCHGYKNLPNIIKLAEIIVKQCLLYKRDEIILDVREFHGSLSAFDIIDFIEIHLNSINDCRKYKCAVIVKKKQPKDLLFF